jgi:hypothetical protein
MADRTPVTIIKEEAEVPRSLAATVICYRRGCTRMGRSGEVPFLFIRHAPANVVNDNTPPHTSPRSLGVFEDRSCQRLGNPWRARPVHRGPEVFLWKALVAQRWRERDGCHKPTTSTKRSGQLSRIAWPR